MALVPPRSRVHAVKGLSGGRVEGCGRRPGLARRVGSVWSACSSSSRNCVLVPTAGWVENRRRRGRLGGPGN